MIRLWQWFFGIPCRFCGERVKWPATTLHYYGGVCAECRATTFAWLAELGAYITWPKD